VTAVTPGRAPRDLRAEQVRREFAGWFEAQGYPSPEDRYDGEEMAEAFGGGMQAERDLTATVGDGTLRTRITRLADTWEHNPELTEEGHLLRELAEILRDELHHASDAPQEPPGDSVAGHPDDCRCGGCEDARAAAIEAEEDDEFARDAASLDSDLMEDT
jgi:hypothetical protein